MTEDEVDQVLTDLWGKKFLEHLQATAPENFWVEVFETVERQNEFSLHALKWNAYLLFGENKSFWGSHD